MSKGLFTSTRIWVAAIVLFLVGSIVAAASLVDDTAFTPLEVAGVTSACPACHGQIPDYGAVSTVHNKHAALECSRCHGSSGGLDATDSVQTGLRWFGVGAVLVVLTGIIANSIIIGRKNKIG